MKSIFIPQQVTDKREQYEILLSQIELLVSGETDLIATISNDVDSDKLACFDDTDAHHIEKIAGIIEKMF